MEPRINIAIRLMTADLSRVIALDELAKTLNLSTSRLRHLFKYELGVSPLRYLKTQRLLKAKELLENTFLNVEEIMFKVGIKDRSHFVRDFKKAFKCSPTNYRNTYLVTEQEKAGYLAKKAAL